jgi:MoxR-like ATPase
MDKIAELTPSQLLEFLLAVAPSRPVMIVGQPGIGKTALANRFAASVGLPCVSLLGSQLAPEDVMGVPHVENRKTHFHPPARIARDEPYCLFLDEINGATADVQRAFYSLIHERSVGEYDLPPGSIVLAAGNRMQDAAIVRQMSSALVNRMVMVELRVAPTEWLAWAEAEGLDSLVLDYVRLRPDHLCAPPPKTGEPFSTPRSWHMLSDALKGWAGEAPAWFVEASARGCLSPLHVERFLGFVKQVRRRFDLARLLKGELRWPHEPQDRDVLYFLAETFRAHLAKHLPERADQAGAEQRDLAHRAKGLLRQLSEISLEVAQMTLSASEDGGAAPLPAWFMVEVTRDLPRLAQQRSA